MDKDTVLLWNDWEEITKNNQNSITFKYLITFLESPKINCCMDFVFSSLECTKINMEYFSDG